jgi:hypothetical protein
MPRLTARQEADAERRVRLAAMAAAGGVVLRPEDAAAIAVADDSDLGSGREGGKSRPQGRQTPPRGIYDDHQGVWITVPMTTGFVRLNVRNCGVWVHDLDGELVHAANYPKGALRLLPGRPAAGWLCWGTAFAITAARLAAMLRSRQWRPVEVRQALWAAWEDEVRQEARICLLIDKHDGGHRWTAASEVTAALAAMQPYVAPDDPVEAAWEGV